MNQDTKALLREVALTGATLAFCAAMPFAGLHAAAAIVTAPPVASNEVSARGPAVVVDKLAVPVRLEAAGEDPAEPEQITLALEEQGYFRADVPLSYDLQDALHTACVRYDIDYPIALGLIEVESNFQADAVGVDGHDIGLFQIRTSNHAWLSKETGADPTTHEGNIECGVWLIRYLLNQYGSLDTALTAYRYGYDNGSRDYAAKVLSAAEHWRELV